MSGRKTIMARIAASRIWLFVSLLVTRAPAEDPGIQRDAVLPLPLSKQSFRCCAIRAA